MNVGDDVLTTRRVGQRRWRIAAIAAVMAVALAGCGGSGSDESKPTATTRRSSTTVAPDASATAPAPGGAAPGGERSAGSAASAAESPSTTALDVGSGLPIRASVARSCVKPGGTQSITIDIGHKGGVAYNSFYSDGKSGGMENFYGGNNGAETDDHGVWKDTWVVGPTAPAGTVRVDVVAIDKSYLRGHQVVEFDVAGPSGRCA